MQLGTCQSIKVFPVHCSTLPCHTNTGPLCCFCTESAERLSIWPVHNMARMNADGAATRANLLHGQVRAAHQGSQRRLCETDFCNSAVQLFD